MHGIAENLLDFDSHCEHTLHVRVDQMVSLASYGLCTNTNTKCWPPGDFGIILGDYYLNI